MSSSNPPLAAHAQPPQQPPQQSQPALIPLTHELTDKFKPARVFKDAVDSRQPKPDSAGQSPRASPARLQITSLAFDDQGDRCVTAGEDDNFTLYDARKGKKIRTFYSKKYGIAHARFTHRPQNIIYASTKGDHALRYHSMHDNKYLAYLQGHTDTVRSLQMNPTDDTFLSAGDDGTVRLWDLRSSTCRGLINDVGGSTIAAWDSGGVVFAVACSEVQTVMLFDSSSLDDAPFAHASLIDVKLSHISNPPPLPRFTSLSFSNDGKYLLVGTSLDVHYVLDAFNLTILRRLEGHAGLGLLSGEEVCWSADSGWVFSGSADGHVAAWDLAPPEGFDKLEVPANRSESAPTLTPAVTLRPGDGEHAASRAVKFNPRYTLLGVGGDELVSAPPAAWLEVRR